MSLVIRILIICGLVLSISCDEIKTSAADSAANEGAEGSEGSEGNEFSNSEVDTAPNALATGELASAYPEGLNVSAFSNDTSNAEVVSSTGSLTIDYGTTLALSSATNSFNLLEVQAGDDGMLTCADSIDEFNASDPNKPELKSESIFENAADNKSAYKKGIEAKERLSSKRDCIDDELSKTLSRLLKHSIQVNLDGTSCYRPDWGVLAKNYGETDEVCMVGFTRNEISKLASYVDFAQLMVQGMICQAQKDGKVEGALEAGSTIDMTAALKDKMGGNITLSAASIGRDTDNGTRPIYKSSATLAVTGPDKDGTTSTFEMKIRLTHSPISSDEDGNSEYDGVISIEHEMPQHALGPDVSGSMGRALSLVYSRTNKTHGDNILPNIQYEFRSGEFKEGLNVFDDADIVDFNKYSDFTTNASTSQLYGSWQSATTSLALVDLRMCASGEQPNGQCKNPCQEGQTPEANDCVTQQGTNNDNNTANNGGAPANDAGSLGDENGFLQRMNRITYDGYPDVGVNKISYWVNFGGLYYESARGFVFNTELVDGTLKGCGIAGASAPFNPQNQLDVYSIRRSLNESHNLIPKGFWRPFLCEESKKGGPEIWRQCFIKNSDGNFVVDLDATTDTATGFDFVDIGNVDAKITQAPNRERLEERRFVKK